MTARQFQNDSSMIEQTMPDTKTHAWVIPFQPVPQPRLRLFCFANAGGSPAQFRLWQRSLPAGVEVCPIQLPGQGSRFREQPYARIAALNEKLAEVLSAYLETPFAFWGYSMGALVAFELALTLKRQGCPEPRGLFVAARRAPHLPPADAPIHALPEAAFIEAIQSRYNGIPTAVLGEPELLALFIPVLRANFEMLETHAHQAGEQLACPLWAFGGLNDPTASAAEIAAWDALTSGTFQHFLFPGDHFFVQNHQPAILQIVSKNLTALLSWQGSGR